MIKFTKLIALTKWLREDAKIKNKLLQKVSWYQILEIEFVLPRDVFARYAKRN